MFKFGRKKKKSAKVPKTTNEIEEGGESGQNWSKKDNEMHQSAMYAYDDGQHTQKRTDEGEGEPQMEREGQINVKQWLTHNKLERYIPIFEKTELTIEELITMREFYTDPKLFREYVS